MKKEDVESVEAALKGLSIGDQVRLHDYLKANLAEAEEGHTTTAKGVECPNDECAGKHPRKTSRMEMLTCRLCGHQWNHSESEAPRDTDALLAAEVVRQEKDLAEKMRSEEYRERQARSKAKREKLLADRALPPEE